MKHVMFIIIHYLKKNIIRYLHVLVAYIFGGRGGGG